jgi:hypothetical protein
MRLARFFASVGAFLRRYLGCFPFWCPFRKPLVTLLDRPPFIVRWNTGLKPEMLQALGNLAVVSAQAEELLHKIYWRHAGLNVQSGPIVTDNLNPKRLEEDITKFVGLDKTKKNILDDLTILFAEFRAVNM